MANILLDEMVVPELIQSNASSDKIFDTASKILSDNQAY
jgi:lipid A disaccharide synthetase